MIWILMDHRRTSSISTDMSIFKYVYPMRIVPLSMKAMIPTPISFMCLSCYRKTWSHSHLQSPIIKLKQFCAFVGLKDMTLNVRFNYQVQRKQFFSIRFLQIFGDMLGGCQQ